jgi:FAD/FMN-containing dehydrogenase
MTRLLAHEPADLVATAQAGLSLTEFQKQLAANGQWLPIDPPNDGTATLGGIVAASIAGPQTYSYGPIRAFVIGLRVALADGRLIRTGGDVVKNVAGYDLSKLFTGSYGTLGVITEVTFKLRPLPAETRTIKAIGSPESLATAGRRIALEFFPSAVELVSARLAGRLGADLKDRNVLLVRFAGSANAAINQSAQALRFLREEMKFECRTDENDGATWQALSAAPYDQGQSMMWLARLRPASLPEFISEVMAAEKDEAAHTNVSWQAGLGDGRLRVMARAPIYPAGAVRLLELLRQKAESAGGSLVLESAPLEIKNEFDSWGSFGSTADLMKRIKQQLDPQNSLSPGRLF